MAHPRSKTHSKTVVYALSEVVGGEFGDIDSANGDLAGGGLEQTAQQIQQRRLARSAQTYHTHVSAKPARITHATFSAHVDVLQDGLLLA